MAHALGSDTDELQWDRNLRREICMSAFPEIAGVMAVGLEGL